MNTPLCSLTLHQNLTKNTSLHLVHSICQQGMKLESSHLHTTKEQCAQESRLQCSPPILSSYQGLYWDCCHQINHWELLKIH